MKSMTMIAVVWKSVFPWFYFMYYLFHCKKKKKDRKMLMWIKRSFVWLKKIALDEYFYEIVFFSHVVAFCSCGGLGKCFVWFEVFFIFSTTRLDSMKYNHSFFPVAVSARVGFARVKWEYIYIFGFFISKTWQKNEIKNFFLIVTIS